jgi:hypothetical protein
MVRRERQAQSPVRHRSESQLLPPSQRFLGVARQDPLAGILCSVGVSGCACRSRDASTLGIQAGSACTPPCPGDPDRRSQDAWWVRSTSGPWSHSSPTTLPEFSPWPLGHHRGRAFSTGQMPGRQRSATIRRRAASAFCRVTAAEALARNGPLGAANELPGGCRRRVPTRRYACWPGQEGRGRRGSVPGSRYSRLTGASPAASAPEPSIRCDAGRISGLPDRAQIQISVAGHGGGLPTASRLHARPGRRARKPAFEHGPSGPVARDQPRTSATSTTGPSALLCCISTRPAPS